jgi:PKD repeat protein
VINGQNVPSPYSNIVTVQVGVSPTPPAAPVQNAIQDDATPDQQAGVDKDGRYRLSWSYPPAPTQQPCGFQIEESGAFGTDYSDDASEALVAGSNSRWTGDANWATLPHLGTGTTGYSLIYTDNLNTSFAMNAAIALPAASAAVLTFDSEEDIEEGFDFGFVQISADGAAYETVAQFSGIFSGARSIDLSAYAGQSIRVRFKVTSDNIISFPIHLGWSIDNIRIERSANFQSIATVSGSTFQYDVTGRSNGFYAYRIAGRFGDCSANPQTGPYSDTEQITVELGPQTANPTAQFTSSPNPAEQNQPVTFDASASQDNDSAGTGAPIVSYQWSFGDGATATTAEAVTQHAYTTHGTYRVTLVVTDNDGETANTEQLIVVNEPPVVGTQEVTGGGNITVNGRKANFSIDVQKDATGVSGEVQYQDKDAKMKMQSVTITSVTITGNRAVITGNCTIDKVGGHTFTLDVTDNGANGSSDLFSIQLSNGYQASGTLTGGNITVKQ